MALCTSSPPDLFAVLPLEILTRIYFVSANPTFTLTSPHTYTALSSPYARLTFCANIFDHYYKWGLEDPRLDLAQTYVVNQRWFDLAFSKKVQAEVGRRVKGRSAWVRIPRAVVGAKLPAKVLGPPWVEEKVELLEQLAKWNLRADWTGGRKFYPGLREAIDERLARVVNIYLGDHVKVLVEGEIVLHAIAIDAGEDILAPLLSVHFDGQNAFEVKGVSKEILKKISQEDDRERAAFAGEDRGRKLEGKGEDDEQRQAELDVGDTSERKGRDAGVEDVKWLRLLDMILDIDGCPTYVCGFGGLRDEGEEEEIDNALDAENEKMLVDYDY